MEGLLIFFLFRVRGKLPKAHETRRLTREVMSFASTVQRRSGGIRYWFRAGTMWSVFSQQTNKVSVKVNVPVPWRKSSTAISRDWNDAKIKSQV